MIELNAVMTVTGNDILFAIGILNLVMGIYLKIKSRVIPYNSTRTNYFSDKVSFTSSDFENMFTNSSENESIFNGIPFSTDTLESSLNPFSREHTGLTGNENHVENHIYIGNVNFQLNSPNSSQESSSSNSMGIDLKPTLNLVKSQVKDLGLNDADESHVKSEIDSVNTLLETPNPDTTKIYTKLERIKQVIMAGAKAASAVSTTVSLIDLIQLAMGT